jgi:hypothetical protein
MTIVVRKTLVEVVEHIDGSPTFPYDPPHRELEVIWPALLVLLKQGVKDGRLRAGNVDVSFRSPGIEEEHESGDN